MGKAAAVAGLAEMKGTGFSLRDWLDIQVEMPSGQMDTRTWSVKVWTGHIFESLVYRWNL